MCFFSFVKWGFAIPPHMAVPRLNFLGGTFWFCFLTHFILLYQSLGCWTWVPLLGWAVLSLWELCHLVRLLLRVWGHSIQPHWRTGRAQPSLFNPEGLISSPRAAQSSVVIPFPEEKKWDGAGLCCIWLFESIFGSLNPFAFSRDHGKENFVFLKWEVSHVTFPFPESLCGTRNGLMKFYD